MDDGQGHQAEGDGHGLVLQKQEWIKTQDMLKSNLILEDDFLWSVPSVGSGSDGCARGKLKYIGGTDISFLKENPSMACAAVVVLDADALEVVHEEFDVVQLQVPYIPGFLAFREAPILLGLLEKVKTNAHHFYPQLLMVDGNGLLHPRGFGLACHLGVLANVPTIGVGKNLHHVDGLNQSEVRRLLESQENCNKELISLTGQSGTTWGVVRDSTTECYMPALCLCLVKLVELNSSFMPGDAFLPWFIEANLHLSRASHFACFSHCDSEVLL